MTQIVIVDAGGQYCHLIARRIRELGVHAEICGPDEALGRITHARGVVISGGPSSVYEVDAPTCPLSLFEAGIPVLGICYGHQLMAHGLGGVVAQGREPEYGSAKLEIVGRDTILGGLSPREVVWMSHGDEVKSPPPGFDVLARTDSCSVAAMANTSRRLYGVQFHPEVAHTPSGTRILRNFVFEACGCRPDWSLANEVARVSAEVSTKAASRNVLFFVSGGVDSTVAFTLCSEALGPERVQGVFVDTGFMRKEEAVEIRAEFARRGWSNVDFVDASEAFLAGLREVSSPEEKRQRIGSAFLAVQRSVLSRRNLEPDLWLLGQGTIYPDTIESGKGSAALIKTHHNRVAEIEEMEARGLVLEPLRDFYKDEVRRIGTLLDLSAAIVNKHPFPGPGLAVRCLCSEASSPCEPFEVQDSSGRASGWTVPLRTVGVQGDGRSYHELVVLKGEADLASLGEWSRKITRATAGTNRVVALIRKRPSAGEAHPMVERAFVTRQRLDLLREADALCRSMLTEWGLENGVWQFPVILLPLSFGAGETIALRPVTSTDGMTAAFAVLPREFVDALAARLCMIDGIGSVVYDVTDKPPATIEWE